MFEYKREKGNFLVDRRFLDLDCVTGEFCQNSANCKLRMLLFSCMHIIPLQSLFKNISRMHSFSLILLYLPPSYCLEFIDNH